MPSLTRALAPLLALTAAGVLAACTREASSTPPRTAAAARTADSATTARTAARDTAIRNLLAPRSKGADTAPVTVYEMSDFQCPYCRRFALESFPALDSAYVQTGKVRWVFINFPLVSIHPNAVPAAELAMCAARQGKFWPVHDLIFQYQKTWSPLKEPGPFFVSLADSAGFDAAGKKRLLACLEKNETRQEVLEDATGAAQAGATATPTFYLEGGLLPGAVPAPVFAQILDSILATKSRR